MKKLAIALILNGSGLMVTGMCIGLFPLGTIGFGLVVVAAILLIDCGCL